MLNAPNVFIVGAPKCGTTALSHYLGEHPSVFVAGQKEPHYFARNELRSRVEYKRDLESYLELYSSARVEHKVRLDSSVWYLYCENSIEEISKFDRNAKIIVMLRRPTEMISSLHSQALVTFDEDILDFENAWKVTMQLGEKRNIPKTCLEPSVIRYDKIAAYGTQLERVFKYFGRDKVHVIFYDDFSKDTAACYREVLKFLSIDDVELNDFNKVNENKVIKYRIIGRYIQRPPAVALNILTFMKKIMRIEKLGLRDHLSRINSKVVKRVPISEQTKAEIVDHYREEIILTSNLTNRDLSSWLVL